MAEPKSENQPSLAPNYDVPENVSPFVMLPVLDLCRDCGEAVEPLRTFAVVRDGEVRKPLCWDCARPALPLGSTTSKEAERQGQSDETAAPLPPYRVTREAAIVDRKSGVEIGHVHRNDYGWTARLTSGAKTSMHATRRAACETAWSMRPRSRPGEEQPRG